MDWTTIMDRISKVIAANHDRAIDMVGQRYGRLVVIALDSTGGKHGKRKWLCLCDCGKQKVVIGWLLRCGHTSSCGCLHKEKLSARSSTHGMSKTPTHVSWCSAKTRCNNPNDERRWRDYGGRGIVMCARWSGSFEAFLADMGERPDGRSLDRINGNLGYTCGSCDDCIANNWPMNCRWATTTEQARSQRANRMITAFGRTQCLMDWSDETGVSVGTILGRLDVCNGWSIEDAVSSPVAKQKPLRSISEGYATKIEMWHTAEYRALHAAKGRCFNPKNSSYERYGAKGTRVCAGWCAEIIGFESFLSDVGPRPSDTHSLDRLDPFANYSCGHCEECLRMGWTLNVRWATREEQANNKRNNKHSASLPT